jgi:hypothetical protein
LGDDCEDMNAESVGAFSSMPQQNARSSAGEKHRARLRSCGQTDPAWHIDELPQEDAGGRLMRNFGDVPWFEEILIDDVDLPYNER